MEIQPLVFSLILALITIIIFWIEERIRIRRDKSNVLPRTWNFYIKCFCIVSISAYGLMRFYQMNPITVTASTLLLTQTIPPSQSETPSPIETQSLPESHTTPPSQYNDITTTQTEPSETEIIIPKFQDENVKIPIAPEIPGIVLEPIPEDIPVSVMEEDVGAKGSLSSHKRKKRHHIGTAPF